MILHMYIVQQQPTDDADDHLLLFLVLFVFLKPNPKRKPKLDSRLGIPKWQFSIGNALS